MILGLKGGKPWRVTVALLLGCTGMTAKATTDVANPRDTLVYKDGDRVQGTLARRVDGEFIFESDRFGQLRVKESDGIVIMGEKKLAAGMALPTAAERAENERVTLWDQFSPSVLTAKVRSYFGPWHGRLAFSTEVVSDSANRNNVAGEVHLRRKWERDDVEINSRYDFAETNSVTTTDVFKASGSWRHDFNQTKFAQYRPSAEWNRASKRQGVPNEYLLVQQEIGVGFNLLTTPSRKFRTGVSQNLFNLWNTAPTSDHSSRGVQSAFEEVEMKLPWQMGLLQRGSWYPVNAQRDGWEKRMELYKKLTETLSTSLRHEIRRDNPDGSAQDFTRLKLLFGLDF